MRRENYRSTVQTPTRASETSKHEKRAWFHLLFKQYASKWRAMLLKVGATTFFAAYISATTSCSSFRFASVQLTPDSDDCPVPTLCLRIVLAPTLPLEDPFHSYEVLWQRSVSTTAKSSARNFEKQKFTIPKPCKLPQASWQRTMLHLMGTSRRMNTPADGGRRGKQGSWHT